MQANPATAPKCGMPLVKEKPKAAPKPAVKKPASPQMPMPAKEKPMEMDKMNMPKDSAKGMDMDNMDKHANHNMPAPKTGTVPKKTIVNNTPPRTVRYDLYIKDTMVNFTGKSRRAIAVNGQIPMPTLTFTEGDTAEIYVHNKLKEETSLHWHGLFLPNQYDGVPYLTQMPIKPQHNTCL